MSISTLYLFHFFQVTESRMSLNFLISVLRQSSSTRVTFSKVIPPTKQTLKKIGVKRKNVGKSELRRRNREENKLKKSRKKKRNLGKVSIRKLLIRTSRE